MSFFRGERFLTGLASIGCAFVFGARANIGCTLVVGGVVRLYVLIDIYGLFRVTGGCPGLRWLLYIFAATFSDAFLLSPCFWYSSLILRYFVGIGCLRILDEFV